jgi:aspartate aminotransferase-like enzyme
MATAFGLIVDFVPGDWRHGVDPAAVESKLKEDPAHETKRFGPNKSGFFPYTPATNLLYGLREAIQMLQHDEGLDNVFRRHYRHAGPAIASACKDAVIRSRRKR